MLAVLDYCLLTGHASEDSYFSHEVSTVNRGRRAGGEEEEEDSKNNEHIDTNYRGQLLTRRESHSSEQRG